MNNWESTIFIFAVLYGAGINIYKKDVGSSKNFIRKKYENVKTKVDEFGGKIRREV